MLWGVTLRSPHPHARIRGVDITEALATAGVFAVLTHEDVPGAKHYGLEHQDQPVLAIDVVRYQGEPVALVAADHPETARRAAEQDRRRLRRARAGRRRRGGAAAGQPRGCTPAATWSATSRSAPATRSPTADVVVSATTRSACRTRRSSGPESGLAVPDGVGGVDLYVATQWLHVDQRQVCSALGAAAGAGPAARWPASAARSAAARTCRCTCTAACSRCTPASR